jgi:hypothetical protein
MERLSGKPRIAVASGELSRNSEPEQGKVYLKECVSMNQLSEHEMQLHVTIVGWFHIILGAFSLLFGLCGLLFFMGIGAIAGANGDPTATGVLGIIGMVSLLLFGALALPGMLAGFGLLKRQRWGQVLGVLVGFFNLFNIPIGTAIGVYTLFVLLQTSANDYFAAQGAAGAAATE